MGTLPIQVLDIAGAEDRSLIKTPTISIKNFKYIINTFQIRNNYIEIPLDKLCSFCKQEKLSVKCEKMAFDEHVS